MITGISSRMFRPHTMTVGVRQQIVPRANPVMSKRVAGKVTLLLCAGILVVLAFSQFMRWQIVSSVNQLEQLQTVRNQAGSENKLLLAQRAKLISRDYVADRVGSRFQIFAPGRSQVKKL